MHAGTTPSSCQGTYRKAGAGASGLVGVSAPDPCIDFVAGFLFLPATYMDGLSSTLGSSSLPYYGQVRAAPAPHALTCCARG